MKQSTYPVLDNRPIDQWKVTELREELKSRKLSAKGLKEELVRRLDGAIRSESEAEIAKEEVNDGVDNSDSVADTIVDESLPAVDEMTDAGSESKTTNAQQDDDPVDHCDTQDALLGVKPTLDGVDDATLLNVDQGQQEQMLADVGSAENEVSVTNSQADSGNAVSVDLPGELALESQGDQIGELALESQGGEIGHVGTGDKDLGTATVLDDIQPSHEDEKLEVADSILQVSEVNPSLGFQVSYDSLPSDSISNNETIDLKDNKIADDVKLELDVKPEMVQPSSIDVVPGAGKSHPMDVEEPHENKVSAEHTYSDVEGTEASKKDGSADLGSPEKLNLDRSSGDDSMDEDASESKQIDSTYKPIEVGEKESEVAMVKEDELVDATVDDSSVDKKDVRVENKSAIAATTEKRKLSDYLVEVSEPLKRQRRWNSAKNIKVMESNSIDHASSTTPKDIPPKVSLTRSFSLSNSSTDGDTPKERIVPPPSRSPTNSLRVDRFLRPFTLKAVQELLGKTGTVASFWMDHIKTHCYVTYSSEEEAVKTRSALYNLQWPPNGGRLLIAEFVEPEEVKLRLEPPAPQTQGATQTAAAPATPMVGVQFPVTSPRLARVKQLQAATQPAFSLPPPPPLPVPPPARELVLPPPPPLPEKLDPPVVTLDDLFRKTKVLPRIYYLPLTEAQVQAKLEAQSRVRRQSASFASRDTFRLGYAFPLGSLSGNVFSGPPCT